MKEGYPPTWRQLPSGTATCTNDWVSRERSDPTPGWPVPVGHVARPGTGIRGTSGPMFIGPKTRTFDVDALPAGTYYFDRQAHTGMGGTFIVE